MTRAAKITYLTALAIGLLVGALLGFGTTVAQADFYYQARDMLSSSALADFAYMQYRRADPSHADEALHTCIDLLELLEKYTRDPSRERDLAFAYARLALLQDLRGDVSQSSAYMLKAKYWYTLDRRRGYRDYSDAKMKAAVRILDERLSH